VYQLCWLNNREGADVSPDLHSLAIPKHLHPLAQQVVLHPFDQVPYRYRSVLGRLGQFDRVFRLGREQEVQTAAARFDRTEQTQDSAKGVK
jgi:hypothetical protein